MTPVSTGRAATSPLRRASIALATSAALAVPTALPAQAEAPASAPVSQTAGSAPTTDDAARRGGFKVATLNLREGMSVRQMRHDLRRVRRAGATVVGMQERTRTKRQVRAALPRGWRLVMPQGEHGKDSNPIAYNARVWKLRKGWSRLLARKTWRRNSGRRAHPQFGVAAILRHRATGHTIRAISFHMPSAIHNRRTGGPNWSERDRVEAFWRMSRNLRRFAANTPSRQQFVGMCDCNVTESRDRTRRLLRGHVTRPLRLMNNYTADGYRPGWRIDYVMARRNRGAKITTWRKLDALYTDHPGVVARFRVF